jgi:phosphatidylglycerophosphate synthase
MTEGEVWARELLRELRDDGYRPDAWRRFLGRSLERARATRHARRSEHREVLLVCAAGLAAWMAVAGVQSWLALAGVLWWLLVVAMVDWHLGMLEDDQGRPLRRLGLPNLLSLARAAAVPALPVASPALLAAILIPAGVTDAIDGSLARRRGEQTRLGVWLDGGADALVLSAAAVGAARHGLLPWWAASLVLGRHCLPALAVALAYFVHAQTLVRPASVLTRVPGLVLFAGLAVATVRLPLAAPLVLVGALGGLAALAVGRASGSPGGISMTSLAPTIGAERRPRPVRAATGRGKRAVRVRSTSELQ